MHTLWQDPTVQAARLLGDLLQEGEGLTPAQAAHLQQTRALSSADLQAEQEHVSLLWDDLKSRMGPGAPDGDHTDAELIAFAARRPAGQMAVRLLGGMLDLGLEDDQRAQLCASADLEPADLDDMLGQVAAVFQQLRCRDDDDPLSS